MTLTPLNDGTPGLRTLLQVQTHQPVCATLDSGPSNAVLDFISSTGTLDRYHEIIEPAGWRLDRYRRNPVFQNAHNYGDILFTLGKALVTEVRSISTNELPPSTALFQRIQFATDVNPVARIAYGLYHGQFLNAVSVGFIPLRWEDHPGSAGVSTEPGGREVAVGGRQVHRKYLEQELLEVSAVAIPANPDALVLGVKSGAVSKADLAETLELVRSMTVDYGPWRSPAQQLDAQRATAHPQFLSFARELRRILRRA